MVSISIQSPTFLTPQNSTRHGSLRVTASRTSFDVLVVGGGIIGLTIARQFLIGSDLSVAVVDKAVPCSGATGAGILYPSITKLDLWHSFSFAWITWKVEVNRLNMKFVVFGFRTGIYMDDTQETRHWYMGLGHEEPSTLAPPCTELKPSRSWSSRDARMEKHRFFLTLHFPLLRISSIPHLLYAALWATLFIWSI